MWASLVFLRLFFFFDNLFSRFLANLSRHRDLKLLTTCMRSSTAAINLYGDFGCLPPVWCFYCFHFKAHGISPFSVSSGFPIQPDVKLKKLAFYDILGTLLQPSTLVPSSQARQQEGTYYFHLTPQQATDVRTWKSDDGQELIFQIIPDCDEPWPAKPVEARILNSSPAAILPSRDDVWTGRLLPAQRTIKSERQDVPAAGKIVCANLSLTRISSKLSTPQNPVATNKPGVEPKRPPRPVNITPHVKISPTVANGEFQCKLRFLFSLCSTFYSDKRSMANRVQSRLRHLVLLSTQIDVWLSSAKNEVERIKASWIYARAK